MLSTATINLIVQGVQALIAEAPQIEAAVKSAKDYIASLFAAGLISVDQQNRIHQHIDSIVAAFNAGTIPPEFTVEPDPV